MSSAAEPRTNGSPSATLYAIGLRPAEPVRFRPLGSRRWVIGKVSRVEADGSITLRDPDGAARSFRAELIEVRRPGQRGRLVWQAVSAVATTWEQLELFEPAPQSRD